MKLLIPLAALLLVSGANGFVVQPSARATITTSLGETVRRGYDVNDWKKKRVPDDTEPVTMAKMTQVVDALNAKRGPGAPKIESILDADYLITYLVAMAGPLISVLYPNELDGSLSLLGTAGNCFHLLLAALLWVQTSRVRCVFEENGFEFYNVKGAGLDLTKGARLEKKPGNFVVDGENRWQYDKVSSYVFLPSLSLPILCFMKESQTGEGKTFYGSDQPHFFPALFDAKLFKAEMDKRGVKYGL